MKQLDIVRRILATKEQELARMTAQRDAWRAMAEQQAATIAELERRLDGANRFLANESLVKRVEELEAQLRESTQ